MNLYIMDFSPEAASFYARHRLQKNTKFISSVMHRDIDVFEEEKSRIEDLDGFEQTQDKLASIREESDRELLFETLTVLDEKEYRIVMLRTMGYTFSEIAEQVGHAQSWVHTIYVRAMEKLKVKGEELLNE